MSPLPNNAAVKAARDRAIAEERAKASGALVGERVPLASTPVLLARGITRRCPRCGGRKLFRRWFTMVDTCPSCGLRFEREEGFFLGAFVMNTAITLGSLMLYLVIAFALTLPDAPLVRLAVVGVLLGLIIPIAVYPFTKTIWCAVDLTMRRTMGESWQSERQTGFPGSTRDQ